MNVELVPGPSQCTASNTSACEQPQDTARHGSERNPSGLICNPQRPFGVRNRLHGRAMRHGGETVVVGRLGHGQSRFGVEMGVGVASWANQDSGCACRQITARTNMSAKISGLWTGEYPSAISQSSQRRARPSSSSPRKPAVTRGQRAAGCAANARRQVRSMPSWLTSSPASADRRAGTNDTPRSQNVPGNRNGKELPKTGNSFPLPRGSDWVFSPMGTRVKKNRRGTPGLLARSVSTTISSWRAA